MNDGVSILSPCRTFLPGTIIYANGILSPELGLLPGSLAVILSANTL